MAIRKEAVTKYFKPTPKKPDYGLNIVGIILGGILVIAGLPGFDDGGWCYSSIGFVMAVWGGIAFLSNQSKYKSAYNKSEPKPSDKQMDEWFEQDKRRLVIDAKNKLGLVDEKILNPNDPLVIVGPQSSAKFRVGDDEIVRFSAYEIVVIFLSDYHLGAYSCDFDFATALTTSEQTQEYHYTDVVSVATLNSNSRFSVTTVDGKEHPVQSHQQFSISVASGESIKVTVAFPQLDAIFKEGKLLPTGADKAISTLRTMLREKKGGA